MFMIDSGKLIDGSDCIIMESTERMDIRRRTIYSGDIVKMIDPGNNYFNENYSGIGFIVFDRDKSQFIWRGADYVGFPIYNMSGKAFEILGNVFEDKDFLFQHRRTDAGFNVNGLNMLSRAFNEDTDFLRGFFEQNQNVYQRQVLVEKFISKEKTKLKDENERHIRIVKAEEQRRIFRSMAEIKRKERYMKIYEKIKQEINEGKACA